MKNTLIAIALSLAAAAAFAQSNGGCAAVAASSEQAAGAYRDTFSATQIIDVDFSILVTPGAVNRFGGAHVVEFRIFTPAGHLYQSMAVPFTADAAMKGSRRRIDGYPQPLPVQVLEETTYANAKHLRVKATLPVAGTPIVSNSLYGRWRAEVYVDGETVPCANPALFTITQ